MFKGLCFILEQKVCNVRHAKRLKELGLLDSGQARAQSFNSVIFIVKILQPFFHSGHNRWNCIKKFGSLVIWSEQCGRE